MVVLVRSSAAPPRDYLAYLQSGTWRTKRNRALTLAAYRCERCGTGRQLEVHHRTYDRLGREWDQDLEVLCRDCHRGETIVQTARSQHGVYLQIAAEVWRRKPGQSYVDAIEAIKIRCAQRRIPYSSDPIAKALDLVAGAVPVPGRSHGPGSSAGPPPPRLADGAADALIAKLLGVVVIRTMRHAADRRDHEARVRRQADEFRTHWQARAAHLPPPDEDIARRDRELAEITAYIRGDL
jgi:hypothetical protein